MKLYIHALICKSNELFTKIYNNLKMQINIIHRKSLPKSSIFLFPVNYLENLMCIYYVICSAALKCNKKINDKF
jgi:hypothetical protein